jgi:hypothetical protein
MHFRAFNCVWYNAVMFRIRTGGFFVVIVVKNSPPTVSPFILP